MNPTRRHAIVAILAFLVAAVTLRAQSATTIPSGVLVQPEVLSQQLAAHPGRDLVLQVGSRMLFEEDHIPGAEYAGPASTPAGLEALRARVAALPRTRSIVLYCGCCPWVHCPNIAPAWNLLHEMHFTHVRVLYIAHDFGTDWVARGFHVERSQ